MRDCVELLGYSVDELGWSRDAMADPVDGAGMDTETAYDTASGGIHSSVRAEDDLHAWLAQRPAGQIGHLHGGASAARTATCCTASRRQWHTKVILD